MNKTFVVKKLKKGDGSDWVRLTKVGRARIGVDLRDKVSISASKNSIICEVHQGLIEDNNEMVCRISKKSRDLLAIDVDDSVEIQSKVNSVSKKKVTDKKKISRGIPEICILAIDCSESMRGLKFDSAKKSVIEYLDQKKNIMDGDIVGCIGFDKNALTIFEPTTNYDMGKGFLGKLQLNYGTDLGAALDFSRSLILMQGKKTETKGSIKKSDFARHIILVADGFSSSNLESPVPAAKACKDANIIVDVVGIVDIKGSQEEILLQQLAQITGGEYYSIDSKGTGPTRLVTVLRRKSEKLN